MLIDLVVGIGIVNPPILKGPEEKWHARFYDSSDGQFYAGNGATAWEAIAWALDECSHRRAGLIRPAKNPEDVPTWITSETPAATSTIERKIEPTRLPLAAAPCSAATRRARTKKRSAVQGK